MLFYEESYGDLMNETSDIIRFPEIYDKEQLKEECDDFFFNDLMNENISKMSYRCPCSDYHCEVFQTLNMGKGVRAKRFIPSGTKIGCYLGVLKHLNDKKPNDEWRYNFQFAFKKYFIDGSDIMSIMSLINHSSDKNVTVFYHLHNTETIEECHLVCITTQDIEIGEELFMDYGEEYWDYYNKRQSELNNFNKNQQLITDFFNIKKS
jgi:SET domain-containing protein